MGHPEAEKKASPGSDRDLSGASTDLEDQPGSEPEKNAFQDDSRLRTHNSDDEESRDTESTDTGEVDVPTRTQSVIHRVLSTVVSTQSVDPGPPPDGGAKAWTIAVCMHLVVMNSWGVINSFGIFQTYYSDMLSLPPSTISWIGSVQIFLLFCIGTLAGRLTDAGYFRLVFLTGSFLQLLGIFSASFATTYVQLLLSQGVCVGLANGLLFCPGLAILSTYFSRRRSLAIGIGACGSSTGGVIFPLIARSLLPTRGLGWTLRTIGFIQLASLAFCFFFLKPRVRPRKSGPLVELSAFRTLEYTFYATGAFFFFLGVYVPFYYLASYATTQIRPAMEYTASLNLLLMLNIAGLPGRLVPNFLADRFGVVNMLIPTLLFSTVIGFAWIAAEDPQGLWAWAAFYGVAGGAIQGLFPAGVSSLTDDPRKQGTRIGMVFTIVSFAVLIGPPIAGALIQACDGKYVGAQAFAAASFFAGMLFMMAARVHRSKRVGAWRTKI